MLALDLTRLNYRLTLQEPILGSAPKARDIYTAYVAARAADLKTDSRESAQRA